MVDRHGGGGVADVRGPGGAVLDGALRSAWRMRRPPCSVPPGMRGAGEVLGEEGNTLGRVWGEGEQNGGDHKVAAPPSTAMPTVTIVLGMPEAASTHNSRFRDPNEMGFSPLCAKFKTLQLC